MRTGIFEAKRIALAATLAFAAIGTARVANAAGAQPDEKLIRDARQTIDAYKTADPTMESFFRKSAGYVVFPSVAKGAVGVGAAHGTGVLFEHDHPVGKVTLSQASIGLALGGQEFSQVVFYESPKGLAELKGGKASFSAEVGAVALNSGASARAGFHHGVAVFTAKQGGLMFEASVGGQKFDYQAWEMPKAGHE
jgi:hypothetical protein